MRLNKSTRLPGSTGSWATGTWGIGTWAIGFAMVVVAAAAMLFAARQPSTSADMTAATAQRRAASEAVESAARKASTAPIPMNRTTPVKTSGVGQASKADDQEPVSATITGCLEERKDQTFRLKDTSGVNAPKARSWNV